MARAALLDVAIRYISVAYILSEKTALRFQALTLDD